MKVSNLCVKTNNTICLATIETHVKYLSLRAIEIVECDQTYVFKDITIDKQDETAKETR